MGDMNESDKILLDALVQTKMEMDRSLLTLAAGGIGVLLALLSIHGFGSGLDLTLFGLGALGYLIVIHLVLSIFQLNAEHIREIRQDPAAAASSCTRTKLEQRDRWVGWSFRAAALATLAYGLAGPLQEAFGQSRSGADAHEVKIHTPAPTISPLTNPEPSNPSRGVHHVQAR